MQFEHQPVCKNAEYFAYYLKHYSIKLAPYCNLKDCNFDTEYVNKQCI